MTSTYFDVILGESKVIDGDTYFPVVYDDFSSEIMCEKEIVQEFVEAVFDDRPSVVRMWHELGVPKVIAVADQNKEF
jgi:hypothetical protein